jgi:Flp pilus assembly protein TadG
VTLVARSCAALLSGDVSMTLNRIRRDQRCGTALVETAAIISVFLLLLFGVLEYCRFLYVRQLIANAAREGARYAVVNTMSANIEAETRQRVLAYMGGVDGKVKSFLVQVYHGDATGNKVYAYDASASNPTYGIQSDGTGKYLADSSSTKYYVQSDTGGNYVLNGSTKVYVNMNATTGEVTGVNASAWSSFTSGKKIQSVDSPTNAAFGEYIVVEIDCDYDPILPSFLFMGQTLSIRVKGLMYSEAN